MTPTPDDAMPDEIYACVRNAGDKVWSRKRPNRRDSVHHVRYTRADKPHADDLEYNDLTLAYMAGAASRIPDDLIETLKSAQSCCAHNQSKAEAYIQDVIDALFTPAPDTISAASKIERIQE